MIGLNRTLALISGLPKRTLAFILANASLLAALAWVVIARDDGPAPRQGAQTVTVTATIPDDFSAAIDLSAMSEHPIFHKSRQFVRPPDPGAPDLRPPPPTYQFAGAMILPGKLPVAYLTHVQSGQSLKVRVGEIVEGWTVSAIEPRREALEFAGETISIGAPQQQTIGIVAVAPRSAASESAPQSIRMLTAPGQSPAALGQPAVVAPPPEQKPRTYQPPPST